MERFDVCPQPIWVFDASPEVMEEAVALTKVKHNYVSNSGTKFGQMPLRAFTKSKQFHRREDCKLMTAWFTESINQVKEEYNMPYERLAITELWLTKTFDGGALHGHTHGMSIVSAIFYITDSPGTHFYRDNLFSSFEHPNPAKQLGYADTPREFERTKPLETQFPASAGKLVVFPSRLHHTLKPCPLPAGHVRYSMAFNTCMDGKCGFRGGPGFVDITVN